MGYIIEITTKNAVWDNVKTWGPPVFALLLVALIFLSCGAPSHTPRDLVKEIGPVNLTSDATWTLRRIVKANKEAPDVIPAEFWGRPIRKLNPVRVYNHLFNLVVVLKDLGTVEEGLYIQTMQSSYTPTDDDGFTLDRLEQGVYAFRRTQTKSVKSVRQ